MALEKELATFEQHLSALLRDPHLSGRFALVHGDEIAGGYASFDEALGAGYDLYGLEPFLVKEVVEHEQPQYFSRNIAPCP